MPRRMLNRVRLWVRSNVMRRRLEREMREEMDEHLARSTERLMARGMGREEARRQALREFGNVTWLQEESRYARGTVWLEALAADARFALRQFARRPVTTVVMFVVLAIGMSLSALLFSYVHSYAVQPPVGIPLDDDLVRIRGSRDAGVNGRGTRAFTEDEFREYQALAGAFDAVAGWTFGSVIVDAGSGDRSGLEARATFVTDNYFAVLGVAPVIGPGLIAGTSDDAADATVAVIGYTAWEQLFGGSPGVIGSTVAVNGTPLTIVGVAPERFNGVGGHVRFQVWVPLEARSLIMPASDPEFRAVARLRPGVGMAEASAAAAVVAERSAAEVEEAGLRDASADVVPLLSANGDPMFDRDVRLMSLLVGLLGLLVLAVTCTNVSALLTGLASARRHEIAVRLSLGASRSRIIRQLLTESAVLAVVAGAAALGIVWLALRAATLLLPFLPMELGITWTVTTFTFGVALAVGIVFGLSPAMHATRLAIATAIRDSVGTIATTRARLQRGLVVAQIAFTQPLIVLLAAVLLLILGNNRPQTPTPFGDRLATVSLTPASPVTTASPDDVGSQPDTHTEIGRLIDRLEATPGIEAAVMDWPMARSLGVYAVEPQGGAPGVVRGAVSLVAERASAGYFRARELPMVRGREFREDDTAVTDGGAAAAIIDVDLARRLWPGTDPIGRRMQSVSDSAGGAASLVVVGVTQDPAARARDADEYRIWLPPEPDRTSHSLLIRTAGDAAALLPDIRRVAHEELPGMAARVRTVAGIEALYTRNFYVVLAGIVGAGIMALLLSAIGLYAVVAFSVAVRRREIAVRMAVGAAGRQIVRKFLADGLRMGALGLALGLPVSLIGLRALITATGEEFPTVTLPPITAIAAVGVLAVAAAAVWIPARRAASVDPAVTLRSE